MSDFTETPLADIGWQMVLFAGAAAIILSALVWAFFESGGTVEW